MDSKKSTARVAKDVRSTTSGSERVRSTERSQILSKRPSAAPAAPSPIAANTWIEFDALADTATHWFFSRTPGNQVCSISNSCTLTQILAAFPNVRIHPSTALGIVGLRAGEGGPDGITFNVDELQIEANDAGITTYDFEPDAQGGAGRSGKARGAGSDRNRKAQRRGKNRR